MLVGFARMSTEKFSIRPEDIKNKMVHLTNSSIQKNQKEQMASDNPARASGEKGGTKISLTYLWKRLEQKGMDTAALWKKISELCLKTLMVSEDR